MSHVRRVAAKPVQLRNQNNIAFLHFDLQGLKPWSVGIAAGCLVGEYSGWGHHIRAVGKEGTRYN